MPLNLGAIYLLCVIFVDPIPAPADHPDPKLYEKKQKRYLFGSFGLFCTLFIISVFIGVVLVCQYLKKNQTKHKEIMKFFFFEIRLLFVVLLVTKLFDMVNLLV